MFDSKMAGFELVVRRIGDVECLASGVNCLSAGIDALRTVHLIERIACLKGSAIYYARPLVGILHLLGILPFILR